MAKTILQFIDSNGPNWSPDWGKNENAQQEFDKRVKSLKDFLEKYKNIHEDFSFSKDISNYFKIDSEEGYIEMLIDTKEILTLKIMIIFYQSSLQVMLGIIVVLEWGIAHLMMNFIKIYLIFLKMKIMKYTLKSM